MFILLYICFVVCTKNNVSTIFQRVTKYRHQSFAVASRKRFLSVYKRIAWCTDLRILWVLSRMREIRERMSEWQWLINRIPCLCTIQMKHVSNVVSCAIMNPIISEWIFISSIISISRKSVYIVLRNVRIPLIYRYKCNNTILNDITIICIYVQSWYYWYFLFIKKSIINK